jgi:hypothetical protein
MILCSYRLVYLGTPYSSWGARGPDGLYQAFVEASQVAARLLRAGVRVYSPIAHCHPISLYGGLDPLDYQIWLSFDEAMMAVAEAIAVAMMPGWSESKGIKHEVDYFTLAGKPVYFLDPASLEVSPP